MCRWVSWALIGATALYAQPDRPPDPALTRIHERVNQNLVRVPDLVCSQTIERAQRESAQAPFKIRDTLKLEVGLIGDQERYAWANTRRFDDRELRDIVGSGTVSTGGFALFTKHVFDPRLADVKRAGEAAHNGRRALRYNYEVPWEHSGYRIRVTPHEQTVAFRGHFLADAESLDLLRLEVFSDEIPPELGLDSVRTVIDYSRFTVGAWTGLLPAASEMSMRALDGTESRNRTLTSECRLYQAESQLTFNTTAPGDAPPPAIAEPQPAPVFSRIPMELELAADIALATLAAGDPVHAELTSPLRDGERVLAPAGARVSGAVVRLDTQQLPYRMYEIAIELRTVETPHGLHDISATMADARGGPGLIRQAKELNPTFNRRRSPRMDILVREVQRGQGVLHWDARQPRIPKGLRMRWIVDDFRPAPR